VSRSRWNSYGSIPIALTTYRLQISVPETFRMKDLPTDPKSLDAIYIHKNDPSDISSGTCSRDPRLIARILLSGPISVMFAVKLCLYAQCNSGDGFPV
jgi:hypothetical protein